VPFTAAVTTAGSFDLFGLLAPTNSQVVLRGMSVGAVTTGATAGSVIEIDIFRGSTASSTSAAITPVQILPQSSPAPLVAGSSVTGPVPDGMDASAARDLLAQELPTDSFGINQKYRIYRTATGTTPRHFHK
jgi:hypothetical protein